MHKLKKKFQSIDNTKNIFRIAIPSFSISSFGIVLMLSSEDFNIRLLISVSVGTNDTSVFTVVIHGNASKFLQESTSSWSFSIQKKSKNVLSLLL